MRMTGFWRHFEEDVYGVIEGPSPKIDNALEPTQTRQREEPDQRRTFGLVASTLTKTSEREEAEQDVSTQQYCAIPFTAIAGTQTLTEQREEPDQDEGTAAYSALSNHRVAL